MPSSALLDELHEWLRIPSVSTGGGDPAALVEAAEWAAARVLAAGGTAELRDLGGNPIVEGELAAAVPDAPTVLIYGHYDVQGPGDLARWTSPPFQPEIRDGRIYARGACDDKGNFLPLLHVACAMARAGELPVNVRVLVEGEEEVGGGAVHRWLAQDRRGADAAIVFDSGMADERTPAITIGLRGLAMVTVTVRGGSRELHSGMYGGAALNPNHALAAMLAAVLPDHQGRVRPELAAGALPPTPEEMASWARLPSGAGELELAGATPHDVAAADEFHLRTGARPSLDVHAIGGGEPRTMIPASASATLSVRLVPDQDPDAIAEALERLLADAAPPGATVEFGERQVARPALFAPTLPAIRLASEAIERASGTEPVLMRLGGSIPIVADFAAAGIPTIVSGFAVAQDAFHAPDESYRIESLELGERAARELLRALADLPRG